MVVPVSPKIYHIVHVDRLPSILKDGKLYSDACMLSRKVVHGTTIGMSTIKHRRLSSPLNTQPGLHVGECVPFYFCPRSIMLYMIYRANSPELSYKDGQEKIIHLVADLDKTIDFATHGRLRWAFTRSNAGSRYFEDFNTKNDLAKINWTAIHQKDWRDPSIKEAKQSEFLIEKEFSWTWIEKIGVVSQEVLDDVRRILNQHGNSYCPKIQIEKSWYY